MRFSISNLNYKFLDFRKTGYIFSAVLITISLLSVALHGGLKYGIDFAGGTLIQIKFKEPVDIREVRKIVNALDANGGDIQEFGEPEVIIINLHSEDGAHDKTVQMVKESLVGKYGEDGFIIERVEMVGPKVGSDLSTKAIMSILYSLIGILIYVSYRFEFRFAVAAVVALAHDTIITVGAFSIADKEFALPVVAALLTVIGYSLNDTIVVFDRIREDLRLKRSLPINDLINGSINATLSRTVITSGTTLLVVLAIFIFGGSVIHDFAFALLVGIGIGTYSSIFIASPLLLFWPGTTTQTLSLAVKKK
ncbi:MAG: protein translocase subunit SecF [Nitrospinota bacterium]|nr:protein translocase subunit SecF [Nitrospinota bacterium]